MRDVRAVKPTGHDALFAGPHAHEEHRWWTVEDLEQTSDEVAPRSLASELRALLAYGPPSKVVDVGR